MKILTALFLSPIFRILRLFPRKSINTVAKVFAFLAQHIIQYRRAVVKKNLELAFPEKTKEKRLKIESNFYLWFCQYILYMLSDSKKDLNNLLNNCHIKNFEPIKKSFESKEHLILLSAHFGYWEYLGLFTSKYKMHYLYIIYKTFKNKYFDDLLFKMRLLKSKEGSRIEDKFSFRSIFRIVKENKQPSLFTILSDQAPSPENAYWVTFFNIKTPFFKGTEEIVRKLGIQPLFFDITFNKELNQYVMNVEKLKFDTNTPSSLTQSYAKILENRIRKHPEMWLWSHKRWKHNGITYN